MIKFIWTLRLAYLYFAFGQFSIKYSWVMARTSAKDGYFDDGYSPRDAFNDEVSCWSE